MSNITEEKLKKLLALSERGIGGEAVKAKNLLNKFCGELGITIDSLRVEKVLEVKYYVPRKDQRLFHQLVGKLQETHPELSTYRYTRGPGCLTDWYIKGTASQQLEFKIAYEVYQAAFLEELELFTLAFMDAQGLLLEATNTKGKSSNLTESQMMQLLLMSAGIKTVTPRKALG